MTVLTLIESPELVNETMLGLDGDRDDLGGLSLTAALEDEVGIGVVAIVPGGLDEDAAGVSVSGLGDGSSSLPFPRGVLGGDEAEVGHESSGRTEAPDIVDFAQQC
jgi:hypothetical protein